MANFTEVLHCRENSVTAHSRQDDRELGELLKHRKNARYCIVFKIKSLNYPSIQHTDDLIHFHIFIMFGEVKQTNASECLFSVLTDLKISMPFQRQESSQDSEHMLFCHAT